MAEAHACRPALALLIRACACRAQIKYTFQTYLSFIWNIRCNRETHSQGERTASLRHKDGPPPDGEILYNLMNLHEGPVERGLTAAYICSQSMKTGCTPPQILETSEYTFGVGHCMLIFVSLWPI